VERLWGWFIVDSLLVGYDGDWNMRDEEQPVGRKESNRKQGEETKESRWGFRGMTVRNWLELLIVPLVLVGIGLLFENQQAERQRAMEAQQQALEERRAEAERELAEQRAQDEALQAYLDQMSGLLLERDLRTSEKGSEVQTLARARTLTVLERLDPGRKTAVMRFLGEAVLIQRGEGRDPIIDLGGADLSDADLNEADDYSGFLRGASLNEADLSDADLRWAHLRDADLYDANLSDAFLSYADLNNAFLFHADLRDADLRWADLYDANLKEADLSNASLRGADLNNAWLHLADLRDADLSEAYLRDADLSAANLNNANLRDANLSDANLKWDANVRDANLSAANLSGAEGITNEELEQQAASLKRATMPNGQKYEEWLKSRGEENSGP
jgi:uncharacterized protein YjbI with pentapeptide repeats